MQDIKEEKLQTRFFNKIRELIPSTHSLVDELADLLTISTDSVYRRLRGETALTLDEISLICNHFKISFDMFSAGLHGSVTFSYSPLNNISNFKSYLASIRDDMVKIAKAENRQIVYSALDVPIFHHFNYPILSAFKLFYWLKAIVNEPMLDGKKFSQQWINPELSAVAKEIYNLYISIPSIEIWTTETINSLLKQIEFYWDSGLFETKDDALKVCECVEAEIKCLQKQAEQSSKTNIETRKPAQEHNFMLYQSEIEIGNNCILITMGDVKNVYLTFHTMNKIVTGNSSFCNETQHWLDNLVRKSIPLSGVAEKQRYRFFKRIYEKIAALQKAIAES